MTLSHELWVATERTANTSGLDKVTRVGVENKGTRSDIRRELGAEPLKVVLIRRPPGRLPLEVLWEHQELAWEHIGIPQEELENVAGERMTRINRRKWQEVWF